MTYQHQQTTDEILLKARHYYKDFNDEGYLLEKIAYEWNKASGGSVPIRADENLGIRIAKKVRTRILKHSDGTTITVGMICTDLYRYLNGIEGFDLCKYQIPASLMIAWLVRSLIETWNEDENEQ